MKMNKFIALTAVAVMAGSVAVMAADSISVVVDGKELTFEGQGPVVKEDRTLVPIRGIFEALGAEVTWEEATKLVTATKGSDVVSMTIGSKEIVKNGEKTELEVAAEIIGGSTLVPARAAAEAFGADVKWDADTKVITITKEAEETATTEATTTTTLSVEKNAKADDGKEIITANCEYVQLDNKENAAGIAEINKYLKDTATEEANWFTSQYEEEVRNFYEAQPESAAIPYTIDQKVESVYQTDGKVSVVTEISQGTGGAHPNTERISVTFDLLTGDILTAEQATGKTAKEINQEVMDGFTALIDADPTSFLPTAKVDLEKSIEGVQFNLTADGVCYYLNRYAIAPYSYGVASIIVK